MPLHALNDEKLIDNIIEKGAKIQKKIEELASTLLETRTKSLQGEWRNFKEEIQRKTKKEYKKENYKIYNKIKNLEEDIHKILNNEEIDNNKNAREEIVLLTSEVAHLRKKSAKEQKEQTRAQIAHHREKTGGIWIAINKKKKPRDLIT